MTTCLSVNGLRKDFRSHWTYKIIGGVSDINFSVEENECFAILGANGTGKTTTIKCILGLIHPSAGSFSFFGKKMDSINVKKDIGFLPEQPYFYQHLTVRETLSFYASLFGLTGTEKTERVDYLLNKLKIHHKQSVRIRNLSKGQQQRLGIAQSLLNDPKLVICDEPFSGLDPIARVEIRELFQELKQEGKTIILSSHILHDIEQLCDRAIILRDGRVKMNVDLAGETEKTDGVYRLQLESASGDVSEDSLEKFATQYEVNPLRIQVSEGIGELEVKGKDDSQKLLHMALHSGFVVKEFSPLVRHLEEFFIEANA